MHFNSNENKINNWEAVYKKLVIKVIMELAGKLDLGDGRRGHRWDEGGYVPLRDKIRGVRRGSPDWTVAGRIYMEDRPREVSDWVRRGDLSVAKDRIFVTMWDQFDWIQPMCYPSTFGIYYVFQDHHKSSFLK